jgi:hypothetical protein
MTAHARHAEAPTEASHRAAEPFCPPGWSYNPSSWPQRLPICGLAVLGFAIAMYLALVQWGVFAHVWDPFFASPDPRWPNGSARILHTWVSQVLPVPDAFLGALGYIGDALAGVIGGRARWRTMPWIVLIFALLVGPFGVVSIMLVVFQPVLFHAWCFLCLCSAVVSVSMIGPAMDESLASLQHLHRVKARGGSLWRAFWGLDPAAEEA